MVKKKKTKIKKIIRKKKKKESKGILIGLIIFVVVSVSFFSLAKLSEWGYLGKSEQSSATKSEAIFLPEVKKETREFKGFITAIDQEKKVVLAEIFEPEKIGKQEWNFFLDNSTEIYLTENGEDVPLGEILVDDLVTIKASSLRGKKWIAEKIEIEPLTVFLGEVQKKSVENLTVARNFSDSAISEIIYETAVEARTKILIKDRSKAFDEEGNLDASKILEEKGSLSDIKEGSKVVIYAEENSIPRKGGEITAAKIEIIL